MVLERMYYASTIDSSIVVYVIDCGSMKQKFYNAVRRITTYYEYFYLLLLFPRTLRVAGCGLQVAGCGLRVTIR